MIKAWPNWTAAQREGAERWRQQQEQQKRQRAARQKHLRRVINEQGFNAALRLAGEGGDGIGRAAQLRILKMVEDTVQNELRAQSSKLSNTKSEARAKYRDSRLSKIEAILRDPATTDGERAAAQEAFNKLNKGSAKRTRTRALKAGYAHER
jgi:hypothetical protein